MFSVGIAQRYKPCLAWTRPCTWPLAQWQHWAICLFYNGGLKHNFLWGLCCILWWPGGKNSAENKNYSSKNQPKTTNQRVQRATPIWTLNTLVGPGTQCKGIFFTTFCVWALPWSKRMRGSLGYQDPGKPGLYTQAILGTPDKSTPQVLGTSASFGIACYISLHCDKLLGRLWWLCLMSIVCCHHKVWLCMFLGWPHPSASPLPLPKGLRLVPSAGGDASIHG